MTDEVPTYTAVIYTDGSAIMVPRLGAYGGGAHGYLYTKDDFKRSGDRPKNNHVTPTGYMITTAVPEGTELVKPSEWYNAVYPYGTSGTNNQAELRALCDTISIMNERGDVSKVIIHTDSTYVIGVHKAVSADLDKREWTTSDRPNLEIWEMLADVLAESQDMPIEVRKVKAHDVNVGNNTADRLAYAAREMGGRGVTEAKHKFYKGKYWNDKPTPHPLFNLKQGFFNVGMEPGYGEHMYIMMVYPTAIDYGKQSPEPLFGVVVMNEGVDEIDSVMRKYVKEAGPIAQVAAYNIAAIYTQEHKKYHELLGEDTYNFNRDKRLCVMEGLEICTPIRPPASAQCAVVKTLTMYKVYRDLRGTLTDDGVSGITEVTDQFYEPNAKGKLVFKFTQADRGPAVDITVDGKVINIPMVYGKDVLGVNQLRKLAGNTPKIHIHYRRVNKELLEYHMIVETDEGVGVYANLYVNKIYL